MFTDIEQNAQRQQDRFASSSSLLIEDYYPELHDGQSGTFSCTTCSHLIADLLTRRRILIDLDDLPTEDDLIYQFGVNKTFLLELQRSGLVILATNLDPDRHKNNTWMHDILAEKSTIFKSKRTPQFFRAQYPDIIDEQRELQKHIEARVLAMPIQDYETFISHMDVVPRKADRAGAANKLAWDIIRVDALLGNTILGLSPSARTEDDYTIDDIFERPHEMLDILYRDKLLVVSPHSGALGGSMLVPYERMKQLFSDVRPNEIVREELASHREIMDYLAKVRLKLDPVDLSCADYWRRITHYQREKLLDDLQDDRARNRTAETERNLRLRIARNDPNVSIDEIKDLVESNIAWLRRYEDFCSIGFNCANLLFALFIGKYFSWLGGASYVGGQIIKARSKQIVEFAAPRIQVANFVKYHTGK
jgi:hypothetical protein